MMKKAKIITLISGVMTLAITAGLTYAWFTSEATPANVTVNAATIKIESIDIDPDVYDDNDEPPLPGEEITVSGLSLTNASTRESVVKITVALNAEESEDGEGAALRDTLINSIDGSINIVGLKGRRDGQPDSMVDIEDGSYYIWLDANTSPSDEFSFTFTVPEEMGGNVGYFELGDAATENQDNEHLSKMIFTYEAVAVQGTEAAITDYFGSGVAAEFFPAAP